jgi:hypothetical protein
VERRKEQRFPINSQVTLTVLGILGEPVVAGCVTDMSGSGLRLRLPVPIPCGAPVKVEAGDMLILGEVVRCEAAHGAPAGTTYAVGVHLSHSLVALSDLGRLNRALLGRDILSAEDVEETVRKRP